MKPCILIFGMPRSGTTWIGKLFDSHPDTLYRHEPDSIRKLDMPLFPEKDDMPRYREMLETFVGALPRMRSPEVVGKQPLFPKSYQSAAGLGAYRASVMAAKLGSRVRRHFPCLYRPTAEKSDNARLVWKSIESPGRLGCSIDALPTARGIHLLRHPCGYVASVLRGQASHQFEGGTRDLDDRWLLTLLMSTAAAKKLHVTVDDLARLTPEERLAWRWVLTQEKILADIGGSSRVLSVRYEDVCAKPMEMTQRMFQFVELDWQTQTERFVFASTNTSSSSYYSVFKHPQASAERWRSELSPDVIERIRRVLRRSTLGGLYEDKPLSRQAALGVAS